MVEEIITTFCPCNDYLHGYFPNMLSKSRFIRRLNAIDSEIFKVLFLMMAKVFKATNIENDYAIDSFPIPACTNVRINRCRIYDKTSYRGYCASKQEFFYGIKVTYACNKKG